MYVAVPNKTVKNEKMAVPDVFRPAPALKRDDGLDILDFVFPPRCPLCGEIRTLKEGNTHRACYRKLPWVREPRCKRCGKPIVSETGELCTDCFRNREKHGKSFDGGRALWLYGGNIQKSVLDYKYQGMKSYTDFYADEVVRVLGGWIRQRKIDVLIPVPLHPRKKRMRGFNQAELLAKAVGRRMNIPENSRILYRNRWTDPQKGISGRERRHNLAKSMEVRGFSADFRRIMLVDDIYTTGSTMEVCGQILKEAGAEAVYFVTLCVGYGDG